MKRHAVRLMLSVAFLMVVVALPAQAGKPQPLNLAHWNGGGQYTRYLEKYNVVPLPPPEQRVWNSSGCPWDINDHYDYESRGDLAVGASSSLTNCVIWGYNPMYVSKNGHLAWWSGSMNWYGTGILAPSPKLGVQVCLSPQGRCFTLSPVQVDRSSWQYTLCVRANYLPNDPALVLIPGSTPDPLPYGSAPGMGVPSDVTLKVFNPTARPIKNITARWGFSSDLFYPAGCSRPPTGVLHEYPIDWYVGTAGYYG